MLRSFACVAGAYCPRCVEHLVLCFFHRTSGMISIASDAGKLSAIVAEADKSNFFVFQETVMTVLLCYCNRGK